MTEDATMHNITLTTSTIQWEIKRNEIKVIKRNKEAGRNKNKITTCNSKTVNCFCSNVNNNRKSIMGNDNNCNNNKGNYQSNDNNSKNSEKWLDKLK